MSYSLNVRGATVALAVAAVAPAFDKVIETQPIHAKDKDAAVQAATTFASMLAEPADGQEVSITVSGYLQWQHDAASATTDAESFIGASVSVAASTVAVAKPE